MPELPQNQVSKQGIFIAKQRRWKILFMFMSSGYYESNIKKNHKTIMFQF
jgi:hypothetical protein